MKRLTLTTLVVPEYDPAIAFFTQVLGFRLVEDTVLTPQKRWVVVEPGPGGGALLLAKAASPQQVAAIGNQTGGRVAFFLHTDDIDTDIARLREAGVELVDTAPREEDYGRVLVFRDPFGNKWDLIEPRQPSEEQP
jgi:catechol 2,3-dioxygenase-like lactoylglutathione lyase family enzyme